MITENYYKSYKIIWPFHSHSPCSYEEAYCNGYAVDSILSFLFHFLLCGVSTWTCVYMHVEALGWCWESWFISLSPYSLKQDLSLDPEFTDMASQLALRTPQNYRQTVLLTGVYMDSADKNSSSHAKALTTEPSHSPIVSVLALQTYLPRLGLQTHQESQHRLCLSPTAQYLRFLRGNVCS